MDMQHPDHHDAFPPAPPALLPREASFADLSQHIEQTRTLEQKRRLGLALGSYGGWALAGVFGVYALLAGVQNMLRPAPQDRFEIAFVHDDGSYQAPRDVAELTPGERDEVVQASLVNLIRWTEGYSMAQTKQAYGIVSAMTSGSAQSRYQHRMLDRNDPENPIVLYAMKTQIVPLDIRLDPDKAGPQSWNFSFTQRVISDNATFKDIPMRGSLTFVTGKVRKEVRVPWDPANVVALTYESHEASPRETSAR